MKGVYLKPHTIVSSMSSCHTYIQPNPWLVIMLKLLRTGESIPSRPVSPRARLPSIAVLRHLPADHRDLVRQAGLV